MEPIGSSETSAYNNTLTPGTYPKERKLQSKHGESLKSRRDKKCLLRGTNWVFKQSGLRFVFKGLMGKQVGLFLCRGNSSEEFSQSYRAS